jgi:hypothetical protein
VSGAQSMCPQFGRAYFVVSRNSVMHQHPQ